METILRLFGFFLRILMGILSIDLFSYYRKKFNNLKNLHHFQPLQPFKLLFIHALQPMFVLDEFIVQAKKTKIFTILPKLNKEHTNQMLLQIEFVQETKSILTLIEYNHDIDRNTRYFHKLNTFFRILFDSSNIIQTWGNCKKQLAVGTGFHLFTHGELMKIQFLDIQQDFKEWYNNTFPHRIECSQYLKYNTLESKSCSCSHRPYKTKSSQWSLPQALAYTFDENLHTSIFDIEKILAITKLGCIAREKWSIQQLNHSKKI